MAKQHTKGSSAPSVLGDVPVGTTAGHLRTPAGTVSTGDTGAGGVRTQRDWSPRRCCGEVGSTQLTMYPLLGALETQVCMACQNVLGSVLRAPEA